MTFYDEFKKSYETRKGPPPMPPSPSSPYQDPPEIDPVAADPDAPTVEGRYPIRAAPPPPPNNGGNGGGGNGDDDNHRRRNWWIGGALIAVLIVIVGVVVIHPSGTTSLAKTPTPTASPTPTATPTALPTATAIVSAPTNTTCPAAPASASGTLDDMASFFTIPGVPDNSVLYYISGEDGETNLSQSRVLHACSPGTPTQITQAYAGALASWTSCGAQCYQMMFTHNLAQITKSVRLQSVQANGGVTNYQLALTLDAGFAHAGLTFAPKAIIDFINPTAQDEQDAIWQAGGSLTFDPNTFAPLPGECTASNYTYAQLYAMHYSGHATPISISQNPNQPTVGCLKTANGRLVNFSAYYTNSNQALILSYTVYVTGFA